MSTKKRLLLLATLMIGIALLTGCLSMFLLYQTAFDEQKKRLIDTVQSRARLMEAMVNYDLEYNYGFIDGARESTLYQLKEAHLKFKGFGQTGEFTLAQKDGKNLVFLLSHRHSSLETPQPVPLDSLRAEPMRLAFTKKSGTVIGLDYSGEMVLAAYDFVDIIELGLVAKIDISEIRKPFITAIKKIFAIVALFISIGSFIFLKLTQPFVRQRELLAKFPDENPNPVLRLSRDFTVLYTNSAAKVFLEKIYPQEKFYRATNSLPIKLKDQLVRIFKNGEPYDFEHSIGQQTYHMIVSQVSSESGSFYIYGIDISERVQMMNELELNKVIVQNAMEGILLCDKQGIITFVNNAFSRITGYSNKECIGQTPKILSSGQHSAAFFQDLWFQLDLQGVWEGEIINKRKNGNLYPQETSIRTITDHKGKIISYACIFRDITERKKIEQLLIQQSSTDYLTGLANKRVFDVRLEEEWARAMRSQKPLSLFMIDIDYFKFYNDNYGHQQGDNCLTEVAKTLNSCLSRQTDLLARYGGEEFVAILPVTDYQGALDLAEKMRTTIENQNIKHEYSLSSKVVTVSIGIGLAEKPGSHQKPNDLIQLADQALYRAKKSGRNMSCIKSL